MQYLSAALGFALLSGFLWVYLQRHKKTARIIRETIPGFSLRLSYSGGISEDLSFPAGLVRCGFSPDYDIDLAHYLKPGHSSSPAPVQELAFQLAEGRLAVTSRSKVMMNGVERSSGSIPLGGSLLFRTCRFTFLGEVALQKERSVLPSAAALRKLAVAPAVASLAALMLLVFGLVDLGTSGFFQRPEPRPSIAREQRVQPVPELSTMPEPAAMPEPAPHAMAAGSTPVPAAPIPDPAPVPAPVPLKRTVVVPLRSAVKPEPVKPLPERSPAPAARQTAPADPVKPEGQLAAALTAHEAPRPERRPIPMPTPFPAPVPEPRLVPPPYPAPRMVKPGEPIPEERVDVLFIHAHPDDESIDFGTLMALCREAGLKTATVLLTDGEGGIYQQDYTGPRDKLAATRVQEAARALQFLGSSLYIRLGLRNNPYNSLLEEKGVQEVLRLWNGDAVMNQLAEIMHALKPRVVVSPEGPSFAREHFEHETTGVLTLMALEQLRRTGRQLPEAHLVSVDPRQKDAYTGLVAFPRQRVMERQRQALLSHATQADASFFGVQIIERYSEEYYLIRYWDMALHFTSFFGLASAHPEPAPVPGSSSLVQESGYRQFP